MRRSRYLSATLFLIGTIYAILGTMVSIPHTHNGGCALNMAFVCLMAVVGFGFGTFLTVCGCLCVRVCVRVRVRVCERVCESAGV